MNITNICSLGLFVTLATALHAQCYGGRQPGNLYFLHGYEALRKNLCKNRDCLNCSMSVVAWEDKETPPKGTRAKIFLRRELRGGKDFKDCMNATKDIIDQCVKAKGNEKMKRKFGFWEHKGQWYGYEAWLDYNDLPTKDRHWET